MRAAACFHRSAADSTHRVDHEVESELLDDFDSNLLGGIDGAHPQTDLARPWHPEHGRRAQHARLDAGEQLLPHATVPTRMHACDAERSRQTKVATGEQETDFNPLPADTAG